MPRNPPWKSLATPEPDRDYLFLLSYLPLSRLRSLPRFIRYTLGIRRQLGRTPGVLGYSMRAKLPRGDFWTLSVWEDEEALAAFVRLNPHGDVMSALERHMGRTRFVRWSASGSAVPPSWEEALERGRSAARQEGPETGFVSIGAADEVAAGEVRGFRARERQVAVANVDGNLYAFDDVCPHLQCLLHGGDLDGTTVTCPCHMSDFDVTSGAVLSGPARDPVRTFEVRIHEGALEVRTA